MVAGVVGRIRQVADAAVRVDLLVFHDRNRRHPAGEPGHAELAVDKELSAAEFLPFRIENAHLLIQVGGVVRHQHGDGAVQVLFDSSFQSGAVGALDLHGVPGFETAVFKLHGQLPVQ